VSSVEPDEGGLGAADIEESEAADGEPGTVFGRIWIEGGNCFFGSGRFTGTGSPRRVEMMARHDDLAHC